MPLYSEAMIILTFSIYFLFCLHHTCANLDMCLMKSECFRQWCIIICKSDTLSRSEDNLTKGPKSRGFLSFPFYLKIQLSKHNIIEI